MSHKSLIVMGVNSFRCTGVGDNRYLGFAGKMKCRRSSRLGKNKKKVSLLKTNPNTPHFGASRIQIQQTLVDFGRLDVEQWRICDRTLLEGACIHSLREATRTRFLFYGGRFSCRILADLFVFPGLHDLLVEHAKGAFLARLDFL